MFQYKYAWTTQTHVGSYQYTTQIWLQPERDTELNPTRLLAHSVYV